MLRDRTAVRLQDVALNPTGERVNAQEDDYCAAPFFVTKTKTLAFELGVRSNCSANARRPSGSEQSGGQKKHVFGISISDSSSAPCYWLPPSQSRLPSDSVQ